MEKIIKILVGTGAVWMLFASSMFASLTTTLYTQNDGQPAGYRDPKGKGGEFTAVFSGNTAVSTDVINHYNSNALATVTVSGKKYTGIETFCVEMTQTMTPGTAYDSSFGKNTISPGAAGDRNYLTMGTAYLYSQFAQGILKGYNYNQNSTGNGSREYTSDELQDAIWYLQGEMNSGNQSDWDSSSLLYSFNFSDPTNDVFVLLAEQACGGVAGAEATNTLYAVQVLELTTANGSSIQDQLVYCPVPEPATFAAGAMLLAPLGWTLLRVIRKKESPSDLAAFFSAEPVAIKVPALEQARYRKQPRGPGIS